MKILLLWALSAVCLFAQTNRYETRDSFDRNGPNKFYMGRQIAHVMGHQAADWLERPERELEEKPDQMIESLNLKPGDVVADIGAGTGYITWRMAKKVGPTGKVYAVEIQQEMLDLLSENMKKRSVTNVVQALGTVTDPKLPANSLDLIIMVDVYHEFDHPYEMAEAMCKALKVGGRLAFVEFKKEDTHVPIKEVHKMSEAQVKKEMSVHPLEHSQTVTNLPWQHVIIFKKTNLMRRQGASLNPAPVVLNTAPVVPSIPKRQTRISVEGVEKNVFLPK